VESQLQRIVNGLSRRLQRPTLIADAANRMLVHGPQHGPLDEARRAMVLQRQPAAEWAAWFGRYRIAEASEPVRIPAEPELGLLARLCVPIRHRGKLLGFLWLIDAEGSLTEAELAETAFAAEVAGFALVETQTEAAQQRERRRELVLELLSDRAETRARAAAEVAQTELLVADAAQAVLVVRPIVAAALSPDDTLEDALQLALDHTCHALPRGRYLALAQADRGVLIVAADATEAVGGPASLGTRLHRAAVRACADIPHRVLVGVGDARRALTEIALSYRRAQQAIEVARVEPGFGSVVHWEQLGVYRALVQLPLDEVVPESLDPELARLLENEGAIRLVRTLECYLDHAGDAPETAAALGVNRSSLYYRLRKIEEIAHVDLRDGKQRLALHLGLKLLRLAGAQDPPS
jgi:sugar diacid utilization regulator